MAAGLVGGFSSTFGPSAVQGQPLRSAMEAVGLSQLPRLLVLGMLEGAFTRGDGGRLPGLVQRGPQADRHALRMAQAAELAGALRGGGVYPGARAELSYSLFAKKRLARVEVMGGVFDLPEAAGGGGGELCPEHAAPGDGRQHEHHGTKLGKLLCVRAKRESARPRGSRPLRSRGSRFGRTPPTRRRPPWLSRRCPDRLFPVRSWCFGLVRGTLPRHPREESALTHKRRSLCLAVRGGACLVARWRGTRWQGGM